MFAEQLKLPRHQQWSTVNERDEPDADWLNDPGKRGGGACSGLWHDRLLHEHQRCQHGKITKKPRAIFFT